MTASLIIVVPWSPAAATSPVAMPNPAGPVIAAAAPPQCQRQGEATGPCASKVAFPASFPAVRLHGMIIIISSGGWQSGVAATPVGFTQVYYQKAFNRWLARGYVVAMVEHSDGSGVIANTPTGGAAFINILQWYDQYRSYWTSQPGYGANFPICATGFSSGGHMALMLGAARASLDCIVAEGPPSLINYAAGATHAPGLRQDAQNLANSAFADPPGTSPADVWSPLTQSESLGKLRMPILVGHANNDPLVLPVQTHTFCPRTSTTCRSEYLDAGGSAADPDFTHANVADADLLAFRAKERSWVCNIVSRWTGPCS